MKPTIQYKSFFSLSLWVLALILTGSIIGSLTQPEVKVWYSTLKRSSLTPPDAVFPIVWAILYGMIGACGWVIWREAPSKTLRTLKGLYITQLILNWSWTPIFFHYHMIGLSVGVIVAMNITVGMLIYHTYSKVKAVSLLLLPYFFWILFASYLNFYIWWYN